MHIPNAGHVDDRAPSSEDLADPSHTAVNSDKDDDLVLSSSTLAALQARQHSCYCRRLWQPCIVANRTVSGGLYRSSRRSRNAAKALLRQES